MRYDTPVFFMCNEKKEYDPDAGEWKTGEAERAKRWANVTHMSAERQQKLFGDVRSDRYIIRLQRPFKDAYDSIEINGKEYTVDTDRYPLKSQSLVVEGNG